VTVNTIFEDSHIPLRKWLLAMHLLCSSKKGMSALQLQRELGLVSYKSAWHMAHRIRYAMSQEPMASMLQGTVEADECYIGGKPRYKGPESKRGRGTKKKPVAVLVERDGNVRARPVERVTARELKNNIRVNVSPKAKIVTDDFSSYSGIAKDFAGGHSVVKHSAKKYVNIEGEHTNTAESFICLIKRGHYGVYHQMSKRHLHRYTGEFSFRWDHRKSSDGLRVIAAVEGAKGKRLMYREPA
jgi:transposase-like protein